MWTSVSPWPEAKESIPAFSITLECANRAFYASEDVHVGLPAISAAGEVRRMSNDSRRHHHPQFFYFVNVHRAPRRLTW